MTFFSFGKDAAAEQISCKWYVRNVTSDPESVPLSPSQVTFLGPSTLTVSGTSLSLLYRGCRFLKKHLPGLTKCEWFANDLQFSRSISEQTSVARDRYKL